MISQSDLMLIWEALEYYRVNAIPEGDHKNDAIWDDLCTSMAWIAEDYGFSEKVD